MFDGEIVKKKHSLFKKFCLGFPVLLFYLSQTFRCWELSPRPLAYEARVHANHYTIDLLRSRADISGAELCISNFGCVNVTS